MSDRGSRAVLITGASSGIGRACAVRLASHGWHVFGTTRQSAETVACDLRAELPPGADMRILIMDVDDAGSVDSAVERILKMTNRLDGVVNCAGFGIAGAIEATSDEDAKAIFETNFFGTLRVCRAVLPILRQQGNGVIVNASSIGGRMGLPYQGLYSATKFAAEGLTEALRMEVRPFGIRVALVEPGDFCTGFTDHRRVVSTLPTGEAYASSQQHVLSIVEKDERGGASPEAVARLVERILTARSPRVRYTVGPIAQRVAAGLKRVLPSNWFERVLSLYYGVK